MKKTTIDLIEPFSGPSGMVPRVVVREPKTAEFIEMGEPFVVARNPDGTVYAVENDKTIKAYIEVCIVEPDPLLALAQMSLSDAIRVKAALLDFFRAAREAQANLPSARTS